MSGGASALPSGDSIWFGLMQDEESERIEDLLAGLIICGQCKATLQSYSTNCTITFAEPCAGFLCVEGARLHIRRRAVMDAQSLSGEQSS